MKPPASDSRSPVHGALGRDPSGEVGGRTSAQPVSSGYVDVGPLEMYFERHGKGPPLVLLHGAFGTIESCFAPLLPRLAGDFEVIAAELQGHGRTRDVDRPLSYEAMAADTAALAAALDIPKAHFVGYSTGGAVALQLALDRPELVDRLVYFGGASFDPSGVYAELAQSFESFDPHHSTEAGGTRLTTASRPIRRHGRRWSSR
jgi:pimeloyl-ACP methyl ester carboxylesterase